MVSKIKKAVYQSYQDKIDKVNNLNDSLEEIYNLEPLKKSMQEDIDNFIENYFDMKRSLNFHIKNNEKTISMVWEDPNYSLIVEFFGDGYWKYELVRTKGHDSSGEGKLTTIWEGKAYEYTISKTEQKKYLFLLEEEVEKVTQLKDVFEYDYEPIFKVDSINRNMSDRVRYGWSSLYYDGPLSGYCYIANELHYFTLEEECEFMTKRIYAIYKLTEKEKLMIYWKYFRIVKYINNTKITNKINLFKHNFNKTMLLLLNKIKKTNAKKKAFEIKTENRKIVGYFTF